MSADTPVSNFSYFFLNETIPSENLTSSKVMAIVSSANRTCASEDLLEMYGSVKYKLSTLMNIAVPLISLYFLVMAIRKLCSQSIIQYSTRVMLVATLLFATCHQVGYIFAKGDILITILFKLSDPCNLQRTSYECRFISIAQTTGNCGMVFIQISMSIDRALNLTFPTSYLKLKAKPGIVLTFISFLASFSMWFFLTINDPLTGYLNHCWFYPAGSVRQFNILLYVCSGISVCNVIADTILLKFAEREIEYFKKKINSREYTLGLRFNANVSLKCSKAIFWVSVVECISSMASHGLLAIMMVIGKNLSSSTYSFLLSLTYLAPYSCLVIPILIPYLIEYIKEQSTIGNLSQRSAPNTIEDHFAKIKTAWA